jgi:hypothetical protein
VAESLALGYSTAALAGAAAAVTLAGPRLFAPLLAAAPLALVQVAFDARLRGRHQVAELSGAVALAALAPAVLLAGGWPTAPSLAAGALLATKAVTSVLYVRTRLRLDRNQHPPLAPALAAHAAAVVAAAGMAVAGWAPWIGTVAAGALLLRAAQGLSPDRRAARPQQVGIQELALGIGFALALALGFRALR